MPRRVSPALVVGLIAAGLLLSACGNLGRSEDDSDKLALPKLGACRDLTSKDLTSPSNATTPVACSEDHTAQTFAIGNLPETTGTSYGDKRHGKFVFDTCEKAFREFLGADESLAMRVRLSWAWFRPSERGWDRGARWYRCDLVGGPTDASRLRDLPETAKGLMTTENPDAWLTCANGPTVADSVKVSCAEKHTWRAVTTIKVGQPDDPYPGDRVVEVRTRDFCQESVGGWMHYPPNYDFGYTWFREDRWSVGNRRSVCWAKTDR